MISTLLNVSLYRLCGKMSEMTMTCFCLCDSKYELRNVFRPSDSPPPPLPQFVGLVGVVHRITDRGDIRVQYPNSTRWTINPAALVRVNPLTVGDTVRVIEDANRVKFLQKGHGEWVEMMRMVSGGVGMSGRVIRGVQIWGVNI